MEKLTKLILAMIILIILIIITIIILLKLNKKQIIIEEDNPETVVFTEVEKIVNKNLFYQVEYNINTYFKYIKDNNINAINAISPENSVNLKNKLEAKEMYVLDKISNITIYVYGIVRNGKQEEEYYLIVNMDYSNNTYSINASNKEEFENAKNNNINSKYREEILIEPNTYNEIQEKIITDFEVLQNFFEDYKYKALYKPEEAFKLIDNEYKQEKFNNNINNYKNYIKDNIDSFKDANIVKHSVKKQGQFGIYVAYDNFNNYYEFKEIGIKDYKVTLDNYTVETEEFVVKYNSLSPKEKVISNIDKIFKLINTKNYEEIYKHINNNFKNTYFKNQEIFKNYIVQNFFENNIIGTMSVQSQGEIYIVTIPYKEGLSSTSEERNITINMKLGEGTDFEISFNIN